jgi:protein-disulfide isomerase
MRQVTHGAPKPAPVPRWRSARWRWGALAALVLIGILVPLRMQCVEASSVCHINGLRHLFGPAPGSERAGATTPASSRSSGQDVRDRVPSRGESTPVAGPRAVTAVVVTVFVDWQCPSCKALHAAYGPLFEQYAHDEPGRVQVIYKDFPLNSACNPNLSVGGHEAACEAAVAVRLAREKGREREMVDWLFANQEGLTPEAVKAAVTSVAGVTDFEERYADELEHVRADVAEGTELHVHFTPACYLNGVLTNDQNGRWLPADQLRQLIDAELMKTGAAVRR